MPTEARPKEGDHQRNDINCSSNTRDTIPPAVKEHFFKDREMPDLCKDYQVVGFDADHCIVKYNMQKLTQWMSKVLGEDLHKEAGYPFEITQIDESYYDIGLNNAVWDIGNRTVLKLVEGKEVSRAYIGKKELSREQIVEIYGDPPIFNTLNYPESIKQVREPEGAHYTTMTFFDSAKLPMICWANYLMETGVIKDKTSNEFAADFFKAAERQYAHYNNDVVYKIGEYGDYFPAVVKDPTAFIAPQPELRQSLETLRKRGVKTFLATNSHVEYAELIMKTTFGDDWKILFDLVCCKSIKPRFFNDTSIPFYEIDENAPNLMGRPITDSSDL